MDIFNQPPSISEDTLHYALHPGSESRDEVSVITLVATIQSYVESLLPRHLWHKDYFQLKVSSDAVLPGFFIEGRMRVGDCVDDEWCTVWLLREISSKWDLTISVRDTDGEFLLIEAAEYLPPWLTPSNAENRVWLYRSHLHLIPISHVSAPSTKPHRTLLAGAWDEDGEGVLDSVGDEGYLSVVDALILVRDSSTETRASADIEAAIQKKIHGYPAASSQHVHHAKVYLPLDIAKTLSVNPSLVQRAVETFYTRDGLQLRTVHRMARFPPEPSVLTTVAMTRTAYAQLLGQKFHPPKVFGRWQESEGTPERRWRDVGMKIACGFEMLYQERKGNKSSMSSSEAGSDQAAKVEMQQHNPEYKKYVENLKAIGYYRGELEGSSLWNQLDMRAFTVFLEARHEDDATRRSFASDVDLAVGQAEAGSFICAREEDADDWLNIEASDFDRMLEETIAKPPRGAENKADASGADPEAEERVTREQTAKLREMARRVEEFVEGEGDLDGALFKDEELSDGDDESSDESVISGSADGDTSTGGLEDARAARQTAMDQLVPALDPSDYGRMPSFYGSSQRVARNTTGETDGTTGVGSKPIRPPIIPRDEYDGVDSDDESEEEAGSDGDGDSEEEKPQIVGDIEIDMEEEQEDFIAFARRALGVSDEEWAMIIQDRKARGAFVPDTTTDNEPPMGGAHRRSAEPPSRQPTAGPQPSVSPHLDSFEAVMEAMDMELLRVKPPTPSQPHINSRKGKEKAEELPTQSEGDIEAAMEAELKTLIEEDGESDDELNIAESHIDYNVIKNFLESFKSQSGQAGPVGNLVGRLQPGWALPRDEL